ncbi:uncharacterized protein LOC103484739 isoform X1 [Cucumis melo]|uniref:Uncharacterized protein LOC103484739 isoform X1 n=1 Tax=Cucumis melo TaxID=3656 RepID=A0A1S3B1C1_CUCME|nr:uncharacterized protein LOC103484739 isoform X1 [Cucumis melo]
MSSSPKFFRIVMHRNLEDPKMMIPKKFVEDYEEECNYIFREIPSCKKRLIPKHEIKVSRKKQPSPKKVETVQRFSSKSDHQPSFKVVMRQSNVQGRFNMVSPSCFINPPLNSLFDLLIYFSFVLEVIPYDFAVKYLSEEIGTIKLQTTDCRNWQLLYKWCRTDRATYAYISSGWKHFAEDNRLKEGDIGLFQLVNKHSFSFTKLQNNSLPPEKETAATGNPFFENIPLKFANEYFSPEMQSADLQVGNKKWNVILKQYEDSQVVGGTFRGESGLKDGDKCLFEMVNTEQCVFKVSFSRNV